MSRTLNMASRSTIAICAFLSFIEPLLAREHEALVKSIHSAYKSLKAYGDEGVVTFRLESGDGTKASKELQTAIYRIDNPDLLALSFGSKAYVQNSMHFFEVDHASKEVREGDISEFSWKVRWQSSEVGKLQTDAVCDAASLLIGTLLELQNGNIDELEKHFEIETFVDKRDNTRGMSLTAKQGDVELRCYVNQQNMIERAICAAPQKILENSVDGKVTALQITWRSGAITTEREKVFTALKQRVADIDKQIEKYDRVPINPAGKPGPNFVRIEKSIWQRTGSLIDWIRGK